MTDPKTPATPLERWNGMDDGLRQHHHVPSEADPNQRWRQELNRLPIIHRSSLISYLEHGKHPNAFLHALLAYDKTATLLNSTTDDKISLVCGAYDVLLPLLPPGSYGSYDTVMTWCARHGLAGRQHKAGGMPTYNELARALRCAIDMTQHIMAPLSPEDDARLKAAEAIAARVPFDDVKDGDAGWAL